MSVSPVWNSSSRRVLFLFVLAGLTCSGPIARADDEAADTEFVATKAGAAKPAFLDKMIREAWDAASIKPSKDCTDEEYLRRAYLDVLGRIPTVEEATSFLHSKEKGKRAKLVEYLLKHEDFAKDFANQWTVILTGRKRQERMVLRGELTSWLRQQINADRPWNEIAFDLITAKGSNKENGAVNFPISHLEMEAVPLTSVTTRVFLGQQIQCTQCHDHPSNDWKQADFWGINAFYKGLKFREVRKPDASGAEVIDHLELTDEPTDAFASFDKRNGLMGVAFPRFLDGRKISQATDVDRRVELGKFITDPKNENFSQAFVNRMWGHFLGRGFVNPVDDFGAHNPASHPELLAALGKDFAASGHDIKTLIRWIMNSQAYHLSSMMTKGNEKDETLFSHMALKPMVPEQLFDSLLTATAAHKTEGAANLDRQRDQWLGQFVFAFGNDEGEEGTSFNGTIPQALMMMNGNLMERAVGGKPGSFLDDLKVRAVSQRKMAPPIFMVNNLFLAALSRYPTRGEMTAASAVLTSNPDTVYVLEDLFWALLNSNEFILNH
ncbi:DUF1549 domain-containing protein [Singulisphaera acidiphila]|uniref:DUF1549 domain-containing protein n=1 Tax=Singulisphaera acidiphila (strain ATCC BAA-1392 / DSM 18658 / VKM B-2454 / MOB10) TaxID=886293 RepID=L0DEF8_SINAD|nr:DUF1549 domain-containing protein [Singulisphaera acidiphila]AGA27208.1 Protein of unknown function (DUF1553)/Protein of unknown function (DUF1549) [Singulisphaera acidiphila DSM 18658]